MPQLQILFLLQQHLKICCTGLDMHAGDVVKEQPQSPTKLGIGHGGLEPGNFDPAGKFELLEFLLNHYYCRSLKNKTFKFLRLNLNMLWV